MKRLAVCSLAVFALSVLTDSASAFPPQDGRGRGNRQQAENGERGKQKREGRRGGNPRPQGKGQRRGHEGSFPPIPILRALDTDRDGTISADEIEHAVAALKTLDKNNDGKLTRDELRPQFDGFKGRKPGGRGPGGDGKRPDGRKPDGKGKSRGGRGPGGAGFIERILRFDKNNDGKVTKDELPEPMRRILDRADSNNDGAVDKSELQEAAKRFQQRGRKGDQPRRRPKQDGSKSGR